MGGYWFSKDPDRAWAEKLYLIFIPIFFAYNAVMQGHGLGQMPAISGTSPHLLMWAALLR